MIPYWADDELKAIWQRAEEGGWIADLARALELADEHAEDLAAAAALEQGELE